MTFTILEIAFLIKEIYQSRFNKAIDIHTPDGKVYSPVTTDTPRYTIDNSALRRLGFEPEWDLNKGINDIFDFLEKSQSL